MAAEVKKRAFEPFYTTKQVGSGSGLGLSMIYGFAKQSGGHLSIDSEQDHGTTVKLYLQRDSGTSFQIESSPAQPEDHRGGESVLLIEDDRDVREMTKTMLRSIGYRVTAVGDTSAAQDALREEAHFDVVLSDVVLRGRMSGPQFVEMLTQDHPDLKVLYMSGYTADTAVGEDIIRQGASLLTKPFTMRQLGKLLREVLD
jgi:CheY-like chemotaxis protein